MNDDRYAVAALDELKNNVLLLTMANDHLTDEVFLIKIGNNISRAVEVLKRDITSLKKKYPGKFVNEVDTDSILERIDNSAQRMLKPGKEIEDNHASGALGREIESQVISIRKAVDDIRIKVQGSHGAQIGNEPVTNIMLPIKGIFQSAGNMMILGIKILACIMVLAGVIFAYLYFTMEKDTPFLNEIASSRALIKEKKEQVSKLEQEKEGLYNKRQTVKTTGSMTREERVAALDIEVKIKKIDNAIDQLVAEISVQEKKITDNQDRLDAFKKKPFISKLLKR